MSKLRSDSTWNALTDKQRQMMEAWLFEENLSYKEITERVAKEWGIKSSIWSVRRFYEWRMSQCAMAELADGQDSADEVNGAGTKPESMRSAAWTLLNAHALEKAMAGGEVKDLAALGRLLHEGEWAEIQRKRLELERERFEFRATKAAMAQLPLVSKMTQEELEREEARINGIKARLFGKDKFV